MKRPARSVEFPGQDNRYRLLLKEEIRLRREQGCDVSATEARIEAFQGKMDRAQRIASARPAGPRAIDMHISHAALKAKLLGAWRGRCVGCLLGKPVEGWDMETG